MCKLDTTLHNTDYSFCSGGINTYSRVKMRFPSTGPGGALAACLSSLAPPPGDKECPADVQGWRTTSPVQFVDLSSASQ